MTQSSLILFAHGSRDPLWRAPLEKLASAVGEAMPEKEVRCAYLELCEPSLPAVVAAMVSEGIEDIKILPMFFGVGVHARQDLPALIADLSKQYPLVRLSCEAAVGEHPAMTNAIVSIATASQSRES
jgi:sirohydrochlorin cobaltochelatase